MATSVPVTSDPEALLTTSTNYQSFWKGKKSRVMVFTINNYIRQEVEALRQHGTTCRYLVFGYEIAPTTGTPHLQCFICWDNPRSVLAFVGSITTKEIHIETILKGTHLQAADYCKKLETKVSSCPTGYEEFGDCPRQGARTDFASALAEIKNGTPVEEVVDNQPQLLPMIRSLETYKNKLLKPLQRPVNVIVLWGDSGTGKSRWAYDNHPDLYSKPPTKWWDGYSGQKTILLDDFYGYIPHSELLNVLDRYPFHAEVKCSYVWAQWDTVIITSNKAPELWYSRGLTPELRRRIHKIVFYSIDAPPQTLFPPPDSQETSS